MPVPPNRLKELRELKGLSQEEVATLLVCTAAAVSRHEGSERRLDLPTARLYAKLYRCTTAELFVTFSKRPSGPTVVA